MKKMTTRFGLLLTMLIAGGNYSCNNAPENPKELAAADSLRADIRIADSLLRTLDPEKVEAVEEAIAGNSHYIEDAINKLQDTIDIPTATFLTDYRSTKKILSVYVENHERLRKAVDSLKLATDNLAHDLRNNSLAKGLVPEKCVENEREQVNKVIRELNFLIPAVNQGLAKSDSLAPRIKSYIEELNRKLGEKNIPVPDKKE